MKRSSQALSVALAAVYSFATYAAPTLPAAITPSDISGAAAAMSGLPSLPVSPVIGGLGALSSKVAITNNKVDSAPSAAPVAPKKAPAKHNDRSASEFEALVKESLGTSLPLFGADVFANNLTNGAQSIPAAADYVVGPGDELAVKAWGSIDIDYRATVEADGNIYIPKVGNVFVAGTKFSELRRVVQGAINKSYRNFELAISMGQLRSNDVKVVGLVGTPGTYQLSPYATVLDALSAAGGPVARGTWRAVQVVRGGKVVKNIDLYDLLLKGDQSSDVRLQPGDAIIVNPAAAQVAISGAVTRQAIFEVKAGETLGSLLAHAGGYTVTAMPGQLRIERVSPTTAKREVIEVSGARVSSFALQDGDIVRVPRITGEFANAVTLRGAVAEPMRLAWKDNFKVTDLITSRDQLIETSYWKNRNATIHTTTSNEEALRQSVKRSFDEINWDYAVVERLDRVTLQAQLIPFNLGRALAGEAKDNLTLLPGDTVTVFSKTDVKVPVERQNRYVRLEGEVKQPGVYLATPSDTVRSLVAKAGGLTDYAYLYGAEFKRESTKKQQQVKMRAVVDRIQAAAASAAQKRAADAISTEDTRLNQAEAENDVRLIERLKAMESSGRVVLEFTPKSRGESTLPDMTFEDGDVLSIPAKPSTVGVAGAVFNENAFLFKSGKTVGEYVEQAGGPLTPSASNLYYIAKADGSVVPASRGDELFPGDTVLVMEEVGKKSFTRSLRDWTQIVYQLGLGVAGFSILK